MNSYKIRNNSTAKTITSALLTLMILRILFSLLMVAREGSVYAITSAVIYGLLCLVCIILLIMFRRSEVVFRGSDILYTPPFGSARTLSYRDLQKVSMGGRSYIVYTNDGKKLITFDDFRTENASAIVAFLKSRGVRTEI